MRHTGQVGIFLASTLFLRLEASFPHRPYWATHITILLHVSTARMQ